MQDSQAGGSGSLSVTAWVAGAPNMAHISISVFLQRGVEDVQAVGLIGLDLVQLPDRVGDSGVSGLISLPLPRGDSDGLCGLFLGTPRIDAGLGDHVVSIVGHAASGAVQ